MSCGGTKVQTSGQTIGLLVVMYFKNPLIFPNVAPY